MKTWNDDRGWGFATPERGGVDVFVHARAFPLGVRPQEGDRILMDVGHSERGLRAIRAQLANDPPTFLIDGGAVTP